MAGALRLAAGERGREKLVVIRERTPEEVRAALGLVPLSRGEATLFGVPRKRFRDWRRVGYVPQRLGAGSGVPATVGEVVASGRLARRGIFQMPRAADKTAVRDALVKSL